MTRCEYLLVTNQLEKKVLDDDTVVIYPNVPAKQREYQELTVKAFYLANADVKQVLNSIRSVIKTRDIIFDERLNVLVMRDTPECGPRRRKARRVAGPGRARGRAAARGHGGQRHTPSGRSAFNFPKRSAPVSSGAAGTAGSFTLPEIQSQRLADKSHHHQPGAHLSICANSIRIPIYSPIRMSGCATAKRPGYTSESRVPVITTTSTANVGVSESVSYLDVGLKLELEPNIYLEDEVGDEGGARSEQHPRYHHTLFQASRSTRWARATHRPRYGSRTGNAKFSPGLIQNDERRATTKSPAYPTFRSSGACFPIAIETTSRRKSYCSSRHESA